MIKISNNINAKQIKRNLNKFKNVQRNSFFVKNKKYYII